MLTRIENTPRDYAWGSRTAIAELLGTPASGGPEAELWLGAHPGSPARLAGGGTLAELAPELPFLLKVLAADAPLSLQAHPTPEQAREGFARESAAGVPLDSPTRNYKDPYPKPELIYALSDPFRALCGFRPVEETREALDPVAGDPRIRPLIDRLEAPDALRGAVEWLLGGGEEVAETVAAVVEASAVLDGISWEVARRLAETSPGDPGIAISLLLHAVDLAPGEALFLPAGNIHAYVEGLGIELMTASDNVLRGGLTPKHVDVPELLRVLDFRPLPVPYLRPEVLGDGWERFAEPDGGFALDVVEGAALAAGAAVDLRGHPAIVLVIQGSATVAGELVARGESVFVRGEEELPLRGSGRVVVAR